eukprot:763020-Hanusia_phi.AAC.16
MSVQSAVIKTREAVAKLRLIIKEVDSLISQREQIRNSIIYRKEHEDAVKVARDGASWCRAELMADSEQPDPRRQDTD